MAQPSDLLHFQCTVGTSHPDRSPRALAAWLRKVAADLDEVASLSDQYGIREHDAIRDRDGNTVGTWSLEARPLAG